MLQWMGGSRRKVDASRRSTQKRQKQFFEQRKWHEQQKKDARESFFEEKNPCYQPEKNSRSLDILSLLNLSTGSGEHKSNVHSGTSPSYQDDAACPQNTSVGAPGGHEKALYSTDHKENPLTNSTSKQLSIIDILGDDGPNCELGSSTHEGHVAFSFEGLGKVEMSTPVHSPQQPGRSSCPRARRKGLSSDYLNRGIYGIEFELDRMMVDVELPFRTSPLDGSSCSRGTPDLPGSAEHKLPDTKWFSSNNNFTYLHAFENDEIFGKSKESSNTIWNAYSSFPLPESFHEDCGSLPKSHLYHLDAGSTDFWNSQSCGRREFYFEDCYYWNSANSCSARNNEKQGTCFDDSYHQNQRVRMRAKAEFNIIDSPTSYSKHFKPENFSVSDGEWYSMGCASPHLMDYIDHADMTWFANEDARDNLSLLSEESSTAVVGDLDTQQKMNSNNKRRSQEDVSDGSKEKKFCEMLFSKERNCKRSDIQLGKEMDEPTKSPWPLNQSRAEPEHGNPVFYEKRSDMNNDQPREARYSPGESNSRFRSFYQTSGSKRYVSTCSDFSVGDVLTDWEPKLQVDTLQNFKGSNKYPGEYAPSSFMLEPTTFALDSPGCTFRNLFQDAKKACGTEDSLHSLGSHGTVTGNFVRDVGKIPYFLSDGDKGVDILPFDSSQFVPITEVSGRCKGFSSGKEKSLDVSSSVNRCSNCEEPKEKTPEVKDRTRLFNYSECAEEASLSIEISTVSKGDQDSSDKNQDTQIFT